MEFLLSIKDQLNNYYTILKFFLYFCIGAFTLLILKKTKDLISFLTSKFKKELFINNLKKIFSFCFFIVISISLGWFIIQVFFKVL